MPRTMDERRVRAGEHARLKTWGHLRRIETYVLELLRIDQSLMESNRHNRQAMVKQINRIVGHLLQLRNELQP